MKSSQNPMNNKEKRILELIKADPFISQQALANDLGLSRSTVANLISGLVKKGFIRGKAYVLNESKPIICIGGANMDRKFYLKETMQLGTSNPVHSTQNAGGVARNIAENLGRMGNHTTLLSVCGDDTEWEFINKSSKPYMDTSHVHQISGASTGSYTAILHSGGEMQLALADMDIYEQLSPEILTEHLPLLQQAKCIIADLNCPSETLDYLCEFAENYTIPLVFVAVSAPKMKRLPRNLQALTWLITNRDETEAFFGVSINNEMDWKSAAKAWLEEGVKNIVITNGEKGVMIGHKNDGIHYVPAIPLEEIVDVTGAGDAFSSATIHTWLLGKELKYIAKAGVMNAAKTLQSPYTVRQDLSTKQLQLDLEE